MMVFDGVARRINRERLSAYIGETVRFVGKVLSVEGETLTLEAPDGGSVQCKITQKSPLSKYVEVIADVLDEATMHKTCQIFELGNDINLATVNEAINLSFLPQFRSFFEVSPV